MNEGSMQACDRGKNAGGADERQVSTLSHAPRHPTSTLQSTLCQDYVLTRTFASSGRPQKLPRARGVISQGRRKDQSPVLQAGPDAFTGSSLYTWRCFTHGASGAIHLMELPRCHTYLAGLSWGASSAIHLKPQMYLMIYTWQVAGLGVSSVLHLTGSNIKNI